MKKLLFLLPFICLAISAAMAQEAAAEVAKSINWVEILIPLIAAILTGVLGYFSNNPKYVKAKKILAAVSEMLADNKVTTEELQNLIALITSGDHKTAKELLNDKGKNI